MPVVVPLEGPTPGEKPVSPKPFRSYVVNGAAERMAARLKAAGFPEGDLHVFTASGHSPSDELADSIKKHVRERHSAYAYPREIEFVDDLPKTLTGKIRRVELREREFQR